MLACGSAGVLLLERCLSRCTHQDNSERQIQEHALLVSAPGACIR